MPAPVSNRTVFKMRDLPRRLAMIGGGPIGLGLGQAFAMLGEEGGGHAAGIIIVGRSVGVPIAHRGETVHRVATVRHRADRAGVGDRRAAAGVVVGVETMPVPEGRVGWSCGLAIVNA